MRKPISKMLLGATSLGVLSSVATTYPFMASAVPLIRGSASEPIPLGFTDIDSGKAGTDGHMSPTEVAYSTSYVSAYAQDAQYSLSFYSIASFSHCFTDGSIRSRTNAGPDHITIRSDATSGATANSSFGRGYTAQVDCDPASGCMWNSMGTSGIDCAGGGGIFYGTLEADAGGNTAY